MSEEKRFLTDVGIRDLPFPVEVSSKARPDGQPTVANISIRARIIQEFESRWIDKFIQIIHQHRERIGTKTLTTNITDYLKELEAKSVRIDFDYPFFVEKTTPVSKQKCMVRYLCTFSAKTSLLAEKPKVIFRMEVPVVTTYPGSVSDKEGGLFGQLSVVVVEVEPDREVYPEEIMDLVDRHALSPIYSFLSEADQDHLIQKIHSEKKSSVVTVDEIKEELSKDPDLVWYSVRCSNYGMLHTYSTVIKTEKNMWFPDEETNP
jgi:GTP cyclohydrolase I